MKMIAPSKKDSVFCSNENEKDELNIPEYLVKITKFSTSVRQAIEYSKIIYDMFVRRELIKISEQMIDNAKENNLDTNGQNIIENSTMKAEKYLQNTSLLMLIEQNNNNPS